VIDMLPFVDSAPYLAAVLRREQSRAGLASRFGLRNDVPWLLAVAMMRPGDKLASYRVLSDSLSRLTTVPWQLLVVGDGPARPQVEAAFTPIAGRVAYAGALPSGSLPPVYTAADLYVWPAINEAYGMTLLEAQAAGLPVVAGNVGGVASIVAEGMTGLLVPAGDAPAFAAATSALLADPGRRQSMALAAGMKVIMHHGIATAAETLDSTLQSCIAARAP